MGRVTLRSLGLCVLLVAPARGQEGPTAAERQAAAAAARARAAAQAEVDAAYRALEAYGDGLDVAPPTRLERRQWALERLEGPLAPGAPAEVEAPFHPEGARRQLLDFRAALRARLRRLDPARRAPGTAPRAPRGPESLQTYDVQDLLVVPGDHVGPPMGLRRPAPPARRGGGGFTFDDDEAEEPATGVGVEPDMLLDLVAMALRSDEEDGGSADLSRGRLLVRAAAAAHGRVAALLALLRAGRSGLVALEVRRYALAPATLRALGPGAGALDEAAEDALRQAAGRGEARLISSQRVVAHDGQRVLVRRGTSRSYVADLTVDQTGVVPVLAPGVEVLNLGTSIELRPLVDRAAGRVLLDVALSACAPLPGERREVAGTALELPTLAVARTCAAVNVPLGRGALLGGVLRAPGADESLAEVIYVRVSLIPGP